MMLGSRLFVIVGVAQAAFLWSAQGLGCQMLRRELTEQLVNDNRNPTRFGSGGTPAGEAGHPSCMKYPG